MRKALYSLATLSLFAATGSISNAALLSDRQMDSVIAGYIIAIPIQGCDCYIYIRPQPGPPGTATPMLQTPTSTPPSLDPGGSIPELIRRWTSLN